MPTTQKLYCYVDETGQDTEGALFIVSVIVASAEERMNLSALCEDIEQETGRKNLKWSKTSYPRRVLYMRRVLQEPAFKGKLFISHYTNTKDYLTLTTQSIIWSLRSLTSSTSHVTVHVDALAYAHYFAVGKHLRRAGVHLDKVRGVRKDENDALIRLADSLAGFVRGAAKGQKEIKNLFEQGKQTGFFIIREE